MTTRNDTTGDPIITKATTSAFRDGWDRIYGKRCNHEICCDTCHHWEWDDGKHGFHSGYCPIFHKVTHKEHGKQCTAWEKIHLESTSAQP